MQAKKHRNGAKHPMDGTSRPVARRHIIPVIRVINPLDPRQHVREELTWGRAKTIADYFPVSAPMIVSINGKIVPPEHFGQTYLEKGDNVVLCPIPAGGDGDGKMVLRLIAFIALVVITQGYGAQFAGVLGVGGSATGVAVVQAGMMMAGSMLINAALPPPKPTQASSDNSSSYGIDGAKNTSLEGIPVPVCYGKFRTGGNIIGLYTENNGDDNQTLYMLINAGEGPVISLTDIEVNDQPVTDYKDVEVQTRLGEANQIPISWFGNAISPQNKSQKLTQDWSYHTTDGEIDKVRFDLTAPALCWIKKKDGSTQRHSVPLEFEYRKVGEATFRPMQLASSEVVDWRRATTTKGSGLQLPFAIGSDPNKDIPEGGTAWMIDQTVLRVMQHITEEHTGGPGYLEQADFEWQDENGDPITDQAQVEYLRGIQPDSDMGAYVPIFADGQATMSGQKKSTVRRSYTSPRLPEARYEFRYRRTTPLSTDDTIIDVIYMADVNEITLEPVTYPNTALVALKIRLTDQLSGVPTVTFMNGGRIVRVYDEVAKAWKPGPSHNPAWAVWDMLTHTRYGGGVPTSRLDFEAFREWAKHCDEKGLTWNGPIDTESNVWDAAQLILRVGHAQMINIGTRFSVIIERAAAPVMMFSVANMVEGSYKESWLSTTDRANEVDVTYYDKEQKYASRVIKVVDPAAIAAGAPQRSSAITLQGVVDRETAFKEGQFQLNLNRYILKTVSFTAPLEAIACTVGDLVYVQHDMTDWAQAGRFEAGSTTTSMKLDRDITMASGKTYKLLLMRDSIQRAAGSITSVAGTSVFMNGFDGQQPVKRIKIGTRDLRVAGTFNSGNGYGVILDEEDMAGIAPGQTYQLWDTDVIEEYGVVNSPGTKSTITLQSPAPAAPAQFSNWMFGEAEKVKKTFRVRSISGTSEYTRDISALEYHADVYDFSRYGTDAPIDPNATVVISAARELTIYEETYVRGSAVESNVVASWQAPLWGMYAGADLYVKINDGAETVSEIKSRTSASIPAAKGDTVTARVVAFDVLGRRAPQESAPSFTFKVVGEVPNIDVGGVTGVSYVWSGRDCKVDWRYNAVTRSYEFGSEPVGADAGALDPHFKDYEVKVFSTGGVLRRTEYTTDSAYTYTFDKNFTDGIARRVRIEIRMRDIFNNLGQPAILDAYNPAPEIVSTQAGVSFDSATISYTHDGSADFTGARIYVAASAAALNGAMPPENTLVYAGPDTSVNVPGLMFDTTYYYRVVAVDGFGLTELLPTSTLSFKTSTLNVAAIADGVLGDSKLIPALKTRIDLIDADKSVPGSVNARIETLKTEFTPDMSGYATAASVTAINDVSATSTSANALALHQLKAQVNDAVTGLPVAMSKITALNDVSATSTSAAAKAIYQLTSRLDNVGEVTFEQAFNTQASAINGLSGQYAVKIDNNGYIAGFGLSTETSVAGENTSEFVILADKFGMIMPGYDGVKPFTIGAVGGVPRVILSNALIGDATINSAMIGSAQITSLKLAGEAVTVPVVVAAPDRQRRGPNEGTWIVANTGYMPMAQAGLLYVLVTAGQGFHKNDRYWSFRIKVNGAVVRSVMGRVANDTPVLSVSVPVAVGTAKVEVEWSAHYDVQLGYMELFMMGVKR